MSDSATMEFSAETKTIGDQIAGLTLKQAKELSDYLKAQYGIEAAAAAEKTEFDVVLANAGDKKLEVVKVVKNITGASLMDAKKMVEGAPVTVKGGVSKDEAAKIKSEIEAAGGVVELK
jgi:large subunit ribosomal protein L7/L12